MTYSASSEVRAHLLASGFFVAYGPSTGPKHSTTQAFSKIDFENPEPGVQWLGQEWLDKLSRAISDSNIVLDPSLSLTTLKAHPQFSRFQSKHPTV
jgi:hypothetical protein